MFIVFFCAFAEQSTEVEETLDRIKLHKGVVGVIIATADGVPIRPGMDEEITQAYAAELAQLAAKARSVVRDLDPTNDLTFLRLRSKKHEIMVAPGIIYFPSNYIF
jgi:dynein light chain roadblock-type